MKVKICGIRNEESALCAVENGADALGFMFAESKRRLTPQEANRIIRKLPKTLIKIGVFVNSDKETIDEIVQSTEITMVQLHGNESPDFCQSLPYPTIKAFSIENKDDLNQIHDYPCEYVLLDGPKGAYYGGNGLAFDWSILNSFDFRDKKVILAGGLTPNNVMNAIDTVNPFMVDVSSGVETNGVKDLEKIKVFLSNAKVV